jgi:hypothetical protein
VAEFKVLPRNLPIGTEANDENRAASLLAKFPVPDIPDMKEQC